MGRVVSPTPIPLSPGRILPALVASYDMHGRAVGLFYTQPTRQVMDVMMTITMTVAMVLVITCDIDDIDDSGDGDDGNNNDDNNDDVKKNNGNHINE